MHLYNIILSKNAESKHLFQQFLYLLYRAKATKPKVLVSEKCQASITLLHFLRSRILQSKEEICQVINGKSSDPCDTGVVNHGECCPFSTSRFFGNRCNRSDTREIEQDENKEREYRTWRMLAKLRPYHHELAYCSYQRLSVASNAA